MRVGARTRACVEEGVQKVRGARVYAGEECVLTRECAWGPACVDRAHVREGRWDECAGRVFEERVCGHACSRCSGSVSARAGGERGTEWVLWREGLGGRHLLTGRACLQKCVEWV